MALAQAPSANAPVALPDQADIRAAYRAMSRAFEQHHPERMDQYFAPVYAETRRGSTVTRSREQFLQLIAEENGHALAPVRVSFEVQRFAHKDNGVLVNVDEDTTYNVRAADRKIHKIEYRQRSEDLWIRQSGQWKCLAESDDLPYFVRVDGRPVTVQELKKLIQ